MDEFLSYALGFVVAIVVVAVVILLMGFIALVVHGGSRLLKDQLQAVTTVEVLMSVDDQLYRADDWVALQTVMTECGDIVAPLDQLFKLVRSTAEGRDDIVRLSRHLEKLLADEVIRRGYCPDEAVQLSLIANAIRIGVSKN